MSDKTLSGERVDDSLIASAADFLAQLQLPAVSTYDIGRLVFSRVSSVNAVHLKRRYRQVLESLLAVRLLAPIEVPAGTLGYLLFGKASASPAEIVCSLDPFAYVSHLSAMEYHGLTDRFPKTLYICTPPATEWRMQAAQRMQKDLGEEAVRYLASGLPRLVRPKFSMIGHTPVQFHERSQMGAFRHVSNSSLRVATLGRVFLDMLREPRLCGGIQHVLDIYRSEGQRYLSLIVDEVERHGEPIDKVRAGYVLSEVCHLTSDIIERWVRFAQRGGSRKLDPESEYAAAYSERWKLSLNVPSLSSHDDA